MIFTMRNQQTKFKNPVMGLVICLAVTWAGLTHADITLTFVNNDPSIVLDPYPGKFIFDGTGETFDQKFGEQNPENPANVGSPNTEFRMITPVIPNIGGGSGELDVIFGGEQWIFNDQGEMIDTKGITKSPLNGGCTAAKCFDSDGGLTPEIDPPITATGPAGTNVTLQEDAVFFDKEFNFLAPVVGSPAGDKYGVGTITINGADLTIVFPVLEAQWGGSFFPLGLFQNKGIPFTGTIEPDNHTFVITAEHIITNVNIKKDVDGIPRNVAAPDSEDTSNSFGQWHPTWELHGTLNSDPIANPNSSANVSIGLEATVSASSLAIDPNGDTVTISAVDGANAPPGSLSFDANSIFFTASAVGTGTIDVDLIDGFGGSTMSQLTITSFVDPPPTANDDLPPACGACVTDQNTPTLINVLANDTSQGSDLDPSSVVITSGAQLATAEADGNVTFTPPPDFIGELPFTYTVKNDLDIASNQATVTVQVNATTPSTAAGPLVPAGTNGLTTVQVSEADLLAAGIPADTEVTVACDPECFDFVASINSNPGVIVLTLSGPLPDLAVYRKFIDDAWANIDTSNGDGVKSAAGSLDSCPPPGSSAYGTPLQAGHFCLELTLEDNGPNDADDIAGQVTDPGGPSTGEGETVAFKGQHLDGACSVHPVPVSPSERADWWLVAGFLAWVGLVLRRRRYDCH